VLVLAVAGLVATVAIALRMAQPWGDNYAYESAGGYLVLSGFLAWAASPYLYLLGMAMRGGLPVPVRLCTLAAALLVSVGGVLLLVDAAFVHIDAQGGLVFIVLPVYQWLAIASLHVLGRLWTALSAA